MISSQLRAWVVESIAADFNPITIVDGRYYELDLKKGCVWCDAAHQQPISIRSLLKSLPALPEGSKKMLAIGGVDKFTYSYVTVPDGEEHVKVTQECIIVGDDVWASLTARLRSFISLRPITR